MIRIYDSTERLFNHNGIKVVHPLRADITKADNGDYYAEIQDTTENIAYYQSGVIIRIPTPWGEQGFRIMNPIVRGNKIEVKAWHISYDSKNYVIEDAYAVDKNCNDALAYFNERTDIPSPFTTIGDIGITNSTRIVRKTLFEVFGTLLQEKYGGHWYRDNYTFGIKQTIGQDRGVVLKVGKNITEMETSENWDDVCTKVLPYTVNNTTNTTIELDDVYVEVDEPLYDIPHTKVVKFENEFDTESFETEAEYLSTVKAWLKSQAEEYIEQNKLPKVNYAVSASIDNVSDIGDVIQVKHPRCNINITTEVVSVTYDAIRKKYTKIEFGNFKNKLTNLKQTITEEANKHTDEVVKETKTHLSSKLEEATARINSVLGNSYVIYDGDKILVVDALPKEVAKNVIKISSGGIGFSTTGIDGVFTSAWTLDGTLNMQAINVINLTASLIRGGTLRLGGLDNTSGIFELVNETNAVIARMDKDGLTVYASNGDYVKLNATEGFAGYDIHDKKIYWADGETFHMMNAEVENQITLGGKIKIVPVNTSDNVGIGFVAISQGGI